MKVNGTAVIVLFEEEISDLKFIARLVYCTLTDIFAKQPVLAVHDDCVAHIPRYSRKRPLAYCESCTKSLQTSNYFSSNFDLEKISSGGRLLNEHSLLILHGMNSRGEWFDRLKSTLDAGDIIHTPVYFEKVGWLMLLKHRELGGPLIDQVEKAYQELKNSRPKNQISVIAHSYSSLVLMKLLDTKPEITFNRVILVGSILPRDYEFEHLMPNNIKKLLNECGAKDYCPVIAKTCVADAGSSGTYFFNSSNEFIENRRHRSHSHSSMLKSPDLVKEWLQFIYEPSPRLSKHETKVAMRVGAVAVFMRVISYLKKVI
jgi:hypothetical protein